MATRSSILRRSKKAEREIQQLLWPGSEFAGGAKRPALERQDLRGLDAEGRPWWGEVKNYDTGTTHGAGGPWAVLEAAFEQVMDVISWEPHDGEVPRAFSVLRVKGTALASSQNLVMYQTRGEKVIIPLSRFHDLIWDRPPEAPPAQLRLRPSEPSFEK